MKYSGLEVAAKVLFSVQRAVVDGLENIPNKPFILASNHRSVYDPIIIVLSVLKKIEKKMLFLADEKVIRHFPESFKKLIGVVPSSLSGLRKAKSYLQEGFPVGVFMVPRLPDNQRRIGASWLAKETGFPIIPTAISGRVIHGNALKFAANLFVGFFERKRIAFGEAIWVSREDDSHFLSITDDIVKEIKILEQRVSSVLIPENELSRA